MKKSAILVLILVLALLVAGCARSNAPTGYAAYPQQQQNPNQYYGGGCGVAPAENTGTSVVSPAATNL